MKKLYTLLGAALAVAMLSALPAVAGVTADFELKPVQVLDDCPAFAPASEPTLFVEAVQGCDAVLAEVTGLCLVEADSAAPAPVSILLIPRPDAGCIAIRPSPPG